MEVRTKNIYDLLGNTSDGEEKPVVPVKTVDARPTHIDKRNTNGLPPSKAPAVTGNRRGGANFSGNEAAYRDRNAGRDSNRGKSTDEAPRGARRGGTRGRGGRREEGDRHPSKAAIHSNSEKQAAASWGANEGQAELKDEQAGAEIAESEQKAEGEAAAEGEAREEEPEDKSISFEQYQVQLAEKKQALESEGGSLNVRKPNEGVNDSKWKEFTAISKDEEEEFFPGVAQKKGRGPRTRAKPEKLELENRFIEQPERTRGGGRGGRGGPRGDHSRGDSGRGDSGRGGPRGDGARGRGRGAPRGAPRGDFRGGRGGRQESQAFNATDKDAFPSLGGN